MHNLPAISFKRHSSSPIEKPFPTDLHRTVLLECVPFTGKLCHCGKCHSGNCHSGEKWMSRPFVHLSPLFKFQAHFDKWFGLPQCLKTYHLSLYNIKKDMLLTGPFAMLSMPSFDFHLPQCTEGFLIHLSPLWQLPLWQLPLFPSVAQFPCVLERVGVCMHMYKHPAAYACKSAEAIIWRRQLDYIFIATAIYTAITPWLNFVQYEVWSHVGIP